jgi:hypothetical protein
MQRERQSLVPTLIRSCLAPSLVLPILMLWSSAAAASSEPSRLIVGKWEEVSQNGSAVSPGLICQYFANGRYTCTGTGAGPFHSTWRIVSTSQIVLGSTPPCSFRLTVRSYTTQCGGGQGIVTYKRVGGSTPSSTPTPSPTPTSTGQITATGTSTPTPTPSSSPTAAPSATPTPTQTPISIPEQPKLIGTWKSETANGKPDARNGGKCTFYLSGTFMCTGNNAGSGGWTITGPGQIQLSSNSGSVNCSYSASATALSIDCGSNATATYSRVQPPDTGLVATATRAAPAVLAIIALLGAGWAGIFALGHMSPPSRRRRR